MSVETTESRFLSSTVAAYGSQFGRTLIRLVADLALARLILPEAHGLFDLALAVVVVAGAVRDLGLPYQLIRDPRQPYGAVFAWVVGAGGILAVALAAGASLFSPLNPDLPPVLRVFALYVLLDAVGVVPKLYFERRLRVGRLWGPEIGRGFLFAAVSITLAWLGFGVWSFVTGELVGAGYYAGVLWTRAWREMPLELRVDLIPGLIRESIYLFWIWLAALSAPFVGRFVIEVYEDTFTMAQYNKAHLWALRLQMFVVPAFVRVFYPALVEYRGDRGRFVAAYRLGTVSILSLEVVTAYFLFFNAETVLVDILLGEQWREAVPLLRILCFLPLVDPFTRLGGEMLKVLQEDRIWLLVVVLNLFSLLAFGIWLTGIWGAPGMAWANYLLVGNLLMAWRVFRICGPEFWGLAQDLAWIYLLPLPLFLGVAWFFPVEGWGRFGVSVAAAGVAAGLLAARFYRPFRSFFSPASLEAPGR